MNSLLGFTLSGLLLTSEGIWSSCSSFEVVEVVSCRWAKIEAEDEEEGGVGRSEIAQEEEVEDDGEVDEEAEELDEFGSEW